MTYVSLIREGTSINLSLIHTYISSVYNMSGSMMDTRKQVMHKTVIFSILSGFRDRERNIYLANLVFWILGLPDLLNKNTGIKVQFQIKMF